MTTVVKEVKEVNESKEIKDLLRLTTRQYARESNNLIGFSNIFVGINEFFQLSDSELHLYELDERYSFIFTEKFSHNLYKQKILNRFVTHNVYDILAEFGCHNKSLYFILFHLVYSIEDKSVIEKVIHEFLKEDEIMIFRIADIVGIDVYKFLNDDHIKFIIGNNKKNIINFLYENKKLGTYSDLIEFLLKSDDVELFKDTLAKIESQSVVNYNDIYLKTMNTKSLKIRQYLIHEKNVYEF